MTRTNSQYSLVARVLHWLVAGMIISQYILAELAENAEHSKNVVGQLALLANHKSIGMTILALAVFRIVWRLSHTPAPLPSTMPAWQHTASNLAHWALYVLIFTLPLSGWLMSSSFGYSVSWFNLFSLPDLLAINKPLAANLKEIHEFLGKALFVLAVVHILAALKHHFIDKDDVLKRMATRLSWVLLFATIVVSIGLFGRTKELTEIGGSETNATETSASESRAPAIAKKSTLPVWIIDYADSFIKFSGDQAGAEFRGEWQQWKATIQFSEQALDDSQFLVEIDAASAFTNDEERDEYIAGSEFFDSQQHAQVVFNAQGFSMESDGQYVADAELSVKGLTKPVKFSFTIKQTGERRTLIGSATLDRLAWNIGTGDWADSTWVGHDVDVSVQVIATIDQ